MYLIPFSLLAIDAETTDRHRNIYNTKVGIKIYWPVSFVSRAAIEEKSATTIWRSWICQLELRGPRRVWWGNGNAARHRLNQSWGEDNI